MKRLIRILLASLLVTAICTAAGFLLKLFGIPEIAQLNRHANLEYPIGADLQFIKVGEDYTWLKDYFEFSMERSFMNATGETIYYVSMFPDLSYGKKTITRFYTTEPKYRVFGVSVGSQGSQAAAALERYHYTTEQYKTCIIGTKGKVYITYGLEGGIVTHILIRLAIGNIRQLVF